MNTAALADWLGAGVASHTRVEGGWSRETWRVELVDDRRVALRIEVPDSVLDTPLRHEFDVLSSLRGSAVPLPELIGFDDGGVIGRPVLATSWVEGATVNVWRSDAAAHLSGAALAWSWIEDIVALHDVASSGFSLGDELAHWTSIVRGRDLLVDDACAWLEANQPDPALPCVVHGDLRIGNMVILDTKVTAFLDWEMAGPGDWRADLGYCVMPYNSGKLLEPVALTSNKLVHPRAFVERYFERSGRSMTEAELQWFVALGCLKMMAIFRTGIDAFVQGRSNDPRLAWGSIPVTGLIDDVVRVIEQGVGW